MNLSTQHSSLIHSPEKQLDDTTLEQRFKKLSSLCLELNPYLPLSPEIKEQLKEFHITEFHDPFTITNKLLVLLDEAEHDLKQSQS